MSAVQKLGSVVNLTMKLFLLRSTRKEIYHVSKDEEFTNVKDKIPTLNLFYKDGTVTAANASTINDGAAAVILMSEEKQSL
jgi:hypothetical protein